MQELRDAATVMLVREVGSRLEVLLMRRARGLAFMADRWVFPGGRVDEADGDEAVQGWCEDVGAIGEAAARMGVEAARARALCVAALREVFEESGLLLVRRQGAHVEASALARLREELSCWRGEVDRGERTMVGLMEALGARLEGVRLGVNELVLFAHWITPFFETRRYDTRFFVARAPQGQEVGADERELVDAQWLTPSEALGRYREGALELAPPTLCVLEAMRVYERAGGMEALFRDASRAQVRAILPHLLEEADEGEAVLVLPGDRGYPVGDARYAGYASARGEVTRVVRKGGQWWTGASPG
ncbi:NUDIX hydrolase [Lujinxingia litoralis]|uniref:NUDIX hydrolase n=1 Tax=Lujinxingia litoralis TaxID=2211119 RepID=A0A328C2N2_9DELT|nr:NUDIX domain-containing protein [Lujinxingia litoralis]RAL20697.1 NUDIX hydrolase [Lujinxingia litoralis]